MQCILDNLKLQTDFSFDNKPTPEHIISIKFTKSYNGEIFLSGFQTESILLRLYS